MIESFKNNKKYLIYSFIFTLMTHLIKILNYYPTWDSVWGIKKDWMGMSTSGRWFSGIAEILLSSKYDLQWVTGIEAAFFISLVGVCIVDIFELKEKKLILIAVSLFAVFPSFAATFMYGLWTSAYMFSLFLAVGATFFCIKRDDRLSILFSIIMMTLSLAIYQAYYLFAIIMFAYYLAMSLMEGKENQIIRKTLRFLVMIITSIIFYYVLNKMMQYLGNYKMSTYQGLSEVGKMSVKSIIRGIVKMVLQSGYFFAGKKKVTFYGALNLAILLIIVVIYVKRFLMNGAYSVIKKIVVSILFFAVFPVNYAFYLVSPGVEYHKLMELGMFFAYFSAIILVKKNCQDYSRQLTSKIVLTLLGVLIFYNFVNNNIAYHQASISYEKSYYEAVELMSRIDQIGNPNQKIIIVGEFENQIEDEIITIPHITGADTGNFLNSEWHILRFSKYYLGRNYNACTEEERERILNKIDLSSMSSFPYGNCISVIDNVIVVKLSDT